MIIMHMEGSSFPNWIGTDLHVVPALTGNRMTWTISSGAAKAPLAVIWERLP